MTTKALKSARITSTGDLVAEGTAIYLHAIHYIASSSQGTVVLKSGGASGTTVLTIDTPGLAEGDDFAVPPPGFAFADGCHGTLTNVDGVTIVYTEQ